MNQGTIQMKPADMLKLRWLRMIAIHDLHSDEFDIIVNFTTRYREGESPSFLEEEILAVNEIYERVRTNYLAQVAGANVPLLGLDK